MSAPRRADPAVDRETPGDALASRSASSERGFTLVGARPLRRLLGLLGRVVAVVAIPLALITGNVWSVSQDFDFYMTQFRKQNIARTTGFTDSQLHTIATAFVGYFQGPPGSIDDALKDQGWRGTLFNEREVQHMRDVESLMYLVRRIGLLAVFAMAAVALAAALFRSASLAKRAWTVGVWGASVTLGLLFLAGLASLLDFGTLFLGFHLVSFSNDLWMLDPSRDNLIRIFPQAFFLEATLEVARRTALQALGLGALLALGRVLLPSFFRTPTRT